MTMERDEKMILQGVGEIFCRGAICDGGLALCRQREERLRAEVDSALAAMKGWDWWDYEVAEMLDWLEDRWPDAIDFSDAQECADEISKQVCDNVVSGRASVDYARLGWALDAYAEALVLLKTTEREAARGLGLVK